MTADGADGDDDGVLAVCGFATVPAVPAGPAAPAGHDMGQAGPEAAGVLASDHTAVQAAETEPLRKMKSALAGQSHAHDYPCAGGCAEATPQLKGPHPFDLIHRSAGLIPC